jgi:hypothetical protein
MNEVGVIDFDERLRDPIGDMGDRLAVGKDPDIIAETRVKAPAKLPEAVDLGGGQDMAKRGLQHRPSSFTAHRAVRHLPALNVFVAVENRGDSLLARTFEISKVGESRRDL